MIPSPTQQEALDQATRTFGAAAGRCETIVSDGETFSISRAIEDHCRHNQWSLGKMCAREPRAISYNPNLVIEKWDNISARDYSRVDAIVICPDPREGKVAFIVHRQAKS